jgi:hypothetical protein
MLVAFEGAPQRARIAREAFLLTTNTTLVVSLRALPLFLLCASAALREILLWPKTQKNRRFWATATVRAQFESWKECTV